MDKFVDDTPGRIIPAYAGSTYAKKLVRHMMWDHPRVRGEHWEWVL